MGQSVSRSQHAVWESIAESFDRNRTRTWPHVEAFLRGLPAGSRVLDLMGGNGRHLASIRAAGHASIWADFSRPASRIVARRHPEAAVVVADACAVPLAEASCGAAILVAGLHSLPTAQARSACLGELRRVLRPSGQAQVTVWSRDAPRFRDQGKPGEPLDVVIPWRSDGHDAPRHYYLYTPDALRGDLEAAGLQVASIGPASVVAPDDNLVAHVVRP